MERLTLLLETPEQANRVLSEVFWPWVQTMTTSRIRLHMEARKDTRSLAQNRLMWSVLGDLSRQVTWFGKRLTPEGWKDFITGHLDGQELIPNMDGTGFISIGMGRSTSRMTRKEMTAVIELAMAFGAEQGVEWSDTSKGRSIDPETGEIT
jgi:hypothetical protein